MKSSFLSPVLLTILLIPLMTHAQTNSLNLLIGTYTNTGKSEGIYVYTFNTETGEASLKNKVKTSDPSFLALSADKQYVYAVNELGEGKGAVSAFRYDSQKGSLSLLNTKETGGDSPCHVIVDGENKHVIASNYSGGSLTVFPCLPNGALADRSQLIVHRGSGPDKQRQEKPHVHSATFSPDEKQVLVQDLGTDQITVYPYAASAQLPVSEKEAKTVKVHPASGPRHLTFSANGRFVYLVQEMGSMVTVFKYANEGALEKIQEITMLQPGFKGSVGAADIHISPDGRFLYASNRGDANDLAIYEINPATGKLSHIQNQSVLGKGPRNFTITPDGKYLLVANQYTDDVVIFERDLSTGLLRDSKQRIKVGAPVCLVFDDEN